MVVSGEGGLQAGGGHRRPVARPTRDSRPMYARCIFSGLVRSAMMRQVSDLSDPMWRLRWTACRDHSEGAQDWPPEAKGTDHGTLRGEQTSCVCSDGVSSVPKPRSSANGPRELGEYSLCMHSWIMVDRDMDTSCLRCWSSGSSRRALVVLPVRHAAVRACIQKVDGLGTLTVF